MFLLRKPSVLFAFLEMRCMCISHDMSEEMSTPRYVAEDTDSSMQLWRVYCVGIGFLYLVMWMTWHLEGFCRMICFIWSRSAALWGFRLFSIPFDVTVMSSMGLSASVLSCSFMWQREMRLLGDFRLRTDWNYALRIVAFVGSSWWTELCLCRGATEAESCLEFLRSVEFFVLVWR